MTAEDSIRIMPVPIHDDDDETVWHQITILVELDAGADANAVREELADVLMDMTKVHGFTTHVQELGA